MVGEGHRSLAFRLGIFNNDSKGSRFECEEVVLLKQVFKELALRSSKPSAITKDIFLRYFQLPGLWGDRLFQRYGKDHLVRFEEFLTCVDTCCRGSRHERRKLFFELFDVNESGYLEKDDLITMLSQVSDLEWYMLRVPNTDKSGYATDSGDGTLQVFDGPPQVFEGRLRDDRGSRNSSMSSQSDPFRTEYFETHVAPETSRSEVVKKLLANEKNEQSGVSDKEVDVEGLVNRILKECEFAEDDKLSLADFQAWLEKHPRLFTLFNDAMQGAVWGANRGMIHPQQRRPIEEKRREDTSTAILRSDQIQTARQIFIRLSKKRLSPKHISTMSPLEQSEEAVSQITRSTRDLMSCPKCRVPYIFCPKCHSPYPSIYIDTTTIYIFCLSCSDRFHSCWHCSWSFDNTALLIDQCNNVHRGYLWKIGKNLHVWRKRFYVLSDKILYYYQKEGHTKPKGCIFLDGCYVTPLMEKCDMSDQRSMDSKSSYRQKYGFVIYSGTRECPAYKRSLFANTEKEREEWLAALKTLLVEDSIHNVYEIKEPIGQGKYSVVHRAISKETGQELAVKEVRTCGLSDYERDVLKSELVVLKLLHHPNVIQFIKLIDPGKEKYYIVTEIVRGGDLYDYIRVKKVLTEWLAHRIFTQLLSAVAYLHRSAIVHRDLKPENVLLTDNGDFPLVKLSDFGLSGLCPPNSKLTQRCGTLAYVAPEVLRGERYNHKIDMWSLGVILYLMLSGSLPFPPPTKDPSTGTPYPRQVPMTPPFKEPPWKKVSSSCRDLILKLLDSDPDTRISAAAAQRHIWIGNPSAVIDDDEKAPVLVSGDRSEDLKDLPESTFTVTPK